MTNSIKVPAGQKPAFDKVAPRFAGCETFKPNEAMQAQIFADMQKAFPGLTLVDGKMTLPKR